MDIQDMFGRLTMKALWPAHMRALLRVYLYVKDQQSSLGATMMTKAASDFVLNA